MKPSITLSIILPVHNESDGIVKFLDRLYHVLEHAAFRYEIICVENGSSDDTFSIIQSYRSKHKNVKLIQSSKGWGNAVKKGIQHARGEYCCYMVSDYQIDPKYIKTIYQLIVQEPYDMVKVYRTSRESITRLANSRAYNAIARVIFGIGSMDINATPKIMKTDMLKSIPLKSENIAIDLELMLYLKKHHKTWKEIPAPSRNRAGGISSTNIASVIEMVRYMIRFRFGNLLKKPM